MKDKAMKLAAEFDKRFTSMNSIDVPERVSVPRDEWRALHDAIKQALAARHEPIGFLYEGTASHTKGKTLFHKTLVENLETRWWSSAIPVYTTPPAAQRPWVGLTDEEFRYFASTFDYGTGGLIRAIEAKLREKNT
jgi:hypothetical protein